MRQDGLNPKRKRRLVVTTDNSQGSPIHPDVAKGVDVHGPDQPWGEEITHVAIETGFAYLAVILDAWSRKVVGHGLGRNIDVRLTTVALKAAIASRRPLPGCVFHADRGTQYAASRHRRSLKRTGFFGSMSRRGNPQDTAQAESLMKTLKVEAVCLTEYEIFNDVAADLTNFIDNVCNATLSK